MSPPLEPRLADIVAEAARAWPGVSFDGAALAAFFGQHERGREIVESTDPIDVTRCAEIALAFGCAMGDRAALAAFESRYVATLPARLSSMRLSEAVIDEVKQHVRQKLLVAGDDGRLRLETYAGTGRLEGLVQVVATRAAIEQLRKERRGAGTADPDDALGSLDADADPERRAIRERYRGDIAAALEHAAKSLSSRERSLLRLHLLGGVTLERLAEMFGVHRATVVRWIARARSAMLDATKAELAARLDARPNEVESVMSLLHSRLDLSIERIFRSTADDDTDGA